MKWHIQSFTGEAVAKTNLILIRILGAGFRYEGSLSSSASHGSRHIKAIVGESGCCPYIAF